MSESEKMDTHRKNMETLMEIMNLQEEVTKAFEMIKEVNDKVGNLAKKIKDSQENSNKSQ